MGTVIQRLDSISKELEAARNEAEKQSIKYTDGTEKLNKKIRDLEYQWEADQQRIKTLQCEIAESQRFKKATNPAAHTEVERREKEEDDGSDDRLTEAKLQKLKDKYDPEKVTAIPWPESRLAVSFVSSIQHLIDSYNNIYKETTALVKIASSLRGQVKHHKRRAGQWQRWCAELSARNMAPSSTNLDAILPPVEHVVRQQNDALSTPTSTRAQDAGHNIPISSAVASTASNSSPTPPIIKSELRGFRSETDDSDQSRIIRVKDEPLSPGSLEASSLSQELFPAASEDLDEVGDAVTTPRSRRFAVFEDGATELRQEGPIYTPNFQGERRALQPKNANLNSQFKTPQEPALKRRKTGDSGAFAISTVAEDGEDQGYIPFGTKFAIVKNDTPSKGPVRHPDAYRRLDDLLAARPQRQSPALDRPGIRKPRQSMTPVSGPVHEAPSVNMKQTPSLNGSTKTITNCVKTAEERAVAKRKFQQEGDVDSEDDWEAIVNSVPFKELPVDCLNLSHFKLNPARNQGFDYAFKEVVRGEQRKCLPGCMRTDCCGEKFCAMVRATGIKYDAEKHRALLEDHLGGRKNALPQLSEEAMNELLIEAKARQLANQLGKHRHAYERARSPPGFWRTDMPSTQELAKDRMEADRMERAKILERLSEAMRPDGLWKFADEI